MMSKFYEDLLLAASELLQASLPDEMKVLEKWNLNHDPM
jgi:hypothetical protein